MLSGLKKQGNILGLSKKAFKNYFLQSKALVDHHQSPLSGAENSGESQDETMVIRANSIRKSNFSRLAIEAQAGGGLVL
ncbi:hypothetical protein, partial [Pseudanabaena sp. CCNP1317]|uniref:hypothetical protein n=1 Tax=Pseudanabaena sp. CCNP1317 TaxID=3110253 RepID=UPI002B1F7C89